MNNFPTKTILSIVAISGISIPIFAAQSSKNSERSETTKKLNVIIIMSDDQGYADVEHAGNPYIKTPNLNKLQAESLYFDNFHTATTSAPTRSGLMTGRNCNAVGVWHTINGRSILTDDDYTLANAFKDSGYATAMYGKWHLGDNYPARPFDKGFDDVLWLKGGGIGQIPDYWGNTYFEDTYFRKTVAEKQHGYCTDVWFSETERFVTENQNNPFFCYLALNAPHGPFNVDEKYVAPYRNNPNIPDPCYYGMITNIDDNIGKLMSLLERLDLDENTVVLYFGDNGTSAGVVQDKDGNKLKGYDGGLRGKKGSNFEGGHRQAMIMHLPNRSAQKIEALTAYIDIMPTMISLCNLTPKQEVKMEGIDFLADDYTGIDRTFVIDTQRREHLQKYKQSCVAKNDWRLINGKQLYHLKADRRQQKDISAQYPTVVAQLQAEYEKWWELASERENELSYIPVVAPSEEKVEITSMDLHDDDNNKNVWNQDLVRSDTYPSKTGYWAISVEKSDSFDIDLYRWAPESGLAINATAPKGRYIPNGSDYVEYKGLSNIVEVKLMLDNKVLATVKNPDLSKQSISFKDVKLPKGNHTFKAILTDSNQREFSAWYVGFALN
ncbi:MAG: arylsulfatase [Rikenellaceae bacterium]